LVDLSSEEIEKTWKRIESIIRGLTPVFEEYRVIWEFMEKELRAYPKELFKHCEEVRNHFQQLIPVLPVDVWREVAVIAENLGQPLEIVLGDLVVKALSSDPSELAVFRLKFCNRMLQEGRGLLEKGDLVQASEKYWNAVVQAIKAVASKEGVELKTHRDLWEYVNHLVRIHGDLELARLFANVNYLHRNFYEADLLPELVREYIKDAEKLIEKLRYILGPQAGSQVSELLKI